jgi:hypothetical protein
MKWRLNHETIQKVELGTGMDKFIVLLSFPVRDMTAISSKGDDFNG